MDVPPIPLPAVLQEAQDGPLDALDAGYLAAESYAVVKEVSDLQAEHLAHPDPTTAPVEPEPRWPGSAPNAWAGRAPQWRPPPEPAAAGAGVAAGVGAAPQRTALVRSFSARVLPCPCSVRRSALTMSGAGRTAQPAQPPRPFTATAIYRPATAPAHLGGDWYDAVLLPDSAWAAVIGDVVGPKTSSRPPPLRSLKPSCRRPAAPWTGSHGQDSPVYRMPTGCRPTLPCTTASEKARKHDSHPGNT